jgi:hypothetical protein
MGFQRIKKVEIVPGMISSGHYIDTRLDKLVESFEAHSFPVMGILSITDDEIDGMLRDKTFQHTAHDLKTGIADNITDKKNVYLFFAHDLAEKLTDAI